MPRTGVEPKPPWQTVPRAVRLAVEAALGAEVRRAAREWGGYSPTPTFRLRLADGRRIFFKATGPDDREFSRAAFAREARIYHEIPHLISPWAPRLYGSVDLGDWRVLLLEDLGPRSVPPWTAPACRGVARAYADFHRSTMNAALPAWLPQPEQYLLRESRIWQWLADGDALPEVAALAGDQASAALRWLREALPVLTRAGRDLSGLAPPYALLHGDTRSDNLRWTRGRLRLFDWPHAGIGPVEWDLAAFAQSVTVDGGPQPEQVVSWYGECVPPRAEALDAAVAGVAGFFADAAWRPDPPGLPRLRAFQRAQLRVTLAWAARRLRLPPPDWLAAV